jgi:hypothetical protein
MSFIPPLGQPMALISLHQGPSSPTSSSHQSSTYLSHNRYGAFIMPPHDQNIAPIRASRGSCRVAIMPSWNQHIPPTGSPRSHNRGPTSLTSCSRAVLTCLSHSRYGLAIQSPSCDHIAPIGSSRGSHPVAIKRSHRSHTVILGVGAGRDGRTTSLSQGHLVLTIALPQGSHDGIRNR